MTITQCTEQRPGNVSPARTCSIVTLTVLMLSVFFYFSLYQLFTPSHQPLKLKPPRIKGTDAGHGVSTSGTVSNSVSSSSSKTLPLVCDEECRRFRRLLDAFPADKPKGAVVMLLKGPSSIGYFARSSLLFGANFNDAYDYPVIVFHEENLNSDAYRQRLRSVTNSSLFFQVVHSAFVIRNTLSQLQAVV